MERSLALAATLCLALAADVATSHLALAQMAAPQCNDFVRIKGDAEQKGNAVRNANERHAERKEVLRPDAALRRFRRGRGEIPR